MGIHNTSTSLHTNKLISRGHYESVPAYIMGEHVKCRRYVILEKLHRKDLLGHISIWSCVAKQWAELLVLNSRPRTSTSLDKKTEFLISQRKQESRILSPFGRRENRRWYRWAGVRRGSATSSSPLVDYIQPNQRCKKKFNFFAKHFYLPISNIYSHTTYLLSPYLFLFLITNRYSRKP